MTRIRSIGTRGRRNAKADREWREAVFARWGNKCVGGPACNGECGGALDPAHIYAKGGLYAYLRHVPENGVVACRRLHNWAHANPKKATEYFLSLLRPEEFARLERLRLHRGGGRL